MGFFFTVVALVLIFQSERLIYQVKKLNGKIEHPDNKPKHQKHWGHGKHK